MNHYPKIIQNVIKNLSKLPGIGEKTAERLTMHILRASKNDAEELANSLILLKEKIRFCSSCFALSENLKCDICSDPARDESLLCVVEQPGDMAAIEKSGSFKGQYIVLAGVISPINGIGPDDINICPLIDRVKTGNIKEIILATNTSVEGEATASYINNQLSKYPVKVTKIAQGVPMGGDLKYIDQVTIKRAIETRHDA